MDVDKYFLAIVLPEPYQSRVMALKQYVKDHFNSKAALRSPAHITLHMPFEWKKKKEDILLQSLEKFRSIAPFRAELRNFSCFEPRVVYVEVVKNTKIEALQTKLVAHVKQNLGLMNEAENMRGFHPHVTIAFRDLNREKFNLAWAHFKEQKFEAAFKVNSFHLLKHCPGKWEVYREFNFFK